MTHQIANSEDKTHKKPYIEKKNFASSIVSVYETQKRGLKNLLYLNQLHYGRYICDASLPIEP